jgi:hypothetical protein
VSEISVFRAEEEVLGKPLVGGVIPKPKGAYSNWENREDLVRHLSP